MKKYRLLQQAIDAEQNDLVGDKKPGDEFDHDFGSADVERAVIAAGWVELVSDKKKGGEK